MRRPTGTYWVIAMVGVTLLLPSAVPAEQEAPAGVAETGTAAIPPGGLIYTVKEGDTLWDLSAKYLGSPWKWTEIWERNRYVTNPHYIYPGIQIVIFPPAPTLVPLWEAAMTAPPAPEPAPVVAPVPSPEPAPKVARPKPVPREPYLDIKPEDFARAGEFLREEPEGIGHIWGGRDPKIGFGEGDVVYLKLDKEIPIGQLLGVYRVRRPDEVYGVGTHSGYVKYLIGIIQVEPTVEGQRTARVRRSFEELTRADLISEEIPGYTAVKIVPGAEGLEATVLAGRQENSELATGNFIYLEGGTAAGIAVGNVFRVVALTGVTQGTPYESLSVKSEVAWVVVVRTSKDYSTAYVARSTESFAAGVPARRGIPK